MVAIHSEDQEVAATHSEAQEVVAAATPSAAQVEVEATHSEAQEEITHTVLPKVVLIHLARRVAVTPRAVVIH